MNQWTRKIQKTGPNTLGLNLPKSWINATGLQKGDNIQVTEEDGELQVKGVAQ